MDRRHQRVFFHNRANLIRQIRRENGGVHITFPPAGSDSREVLLNGAKKDVNTAKRAIMEIVANQDAQVVIECNIPRKHHGEVLGPYHANMRALSHEYGVFITVPCHAVNRAEGAGAGNGGSNEASATKHATYRRNVFLIRGKQENCLRAKKALLGLIPRVIRVEVPFRFHRAIVGKRGKRVRAMCNNYLVSIDIPNPELEKDCVYVRGSARNCEEAKEALLERAKELEDEEDSRDS